MKRESVIRLAEYTTVTVHGDCLDFLGRQGLPSPGQLAAGRDNGNVPLVCERL